MLMLNLQNIRICSREGLRAKLSVRMRERGPSLELTYFLDWDYRSGSGERDARFSTKVRSIRSLNRASGEEEEEVTHRFVNRLIGCQGY